MKNWMVYLLCLTGVDAAVGQDVHFTQFFTNPLVLSPAYTGYFNGNIRAGINYKYQWPWASSQQTLNYHTQAGYVDFAFLEKKVKHGWMGIGLNVLNDEAGDGRLRYTKVGCSVAWHQAFDRRNRYVLSIGFMANYVQKSVDFERFYFNDQWVQDVGFQTSVPNYENPNATQFSQMDLSTGLAFHAKVSDKTLVHLGFSALHINRPADRFYTGGNTLGLRYNATLGTEYEFNRETYLMADAYFTYQNKAWEFVFGGMCGIKPRAWPVSPSTFYVGAYMRLKDAFSPTFGYQYKKTRVLVSYDIVYSKLNEPAKLNGGLEFSFTVMGSFSPRHREQKWACPKF